MSYAWITHILARQWFSAHKTLIYSIRVVQGSVRACLNFNVGLWLDFQLQFLSKIFYRVCQQKNFDNPLTHDKVIDMSLEYIV